MKYLYILPIIVFVSGNVSAQSLTVNTPCPASPNCVSTLSQDETHHITPYILIPSVNWSEFINFIKSQTQAEIISQTNTELHSVFTTKWLRFSDDVLFLKNGQTIHFRSSSRMGYSDMGKNRNRMERLRIKLQKNQIIQPTP
jgi:uncharacterized protein (DUF1499 family)